MIAADPPHDIDAERAVIGAMLNSATAVATAAEVLTAADFYRPAHGTLFTTALALADEGTEVSTITVCDALDRAGNLGRVGGRTRVFEIWQAASTALAVPHDADVLARLSIRRRILQASQRMAQLAMSGSDDSPELIERCRGQIDAVAEGRRSRDGDEGVDILELVDARIEAYDLPEPPHLPTGWHDLDRILGGGLRPETLTIVGARTGVGKSVFGICLAVSAAVREVGTLFASLEMSRDEIADRVLSQLSEIDALRLANHKIRDYEWDRLHGARNRLIGATLRVEDTPNLGLTRLRALARDCSRRPGGLGLIVADYLQLMRPGDERVPREQQVAAISRGLKLMSKEFRVPVLALAQLNRESEKRLSRRPVISDLRESGALEQDCDYVMLLHRDEDETPGEITVDVAKNRHGPPGIAQLSWTPHLSRIASLAPRLEVV